jgi:hypothetical protein
MSLGDRLRRALDGGGDQRGRRPHAQATRVGGFEPEGRPLQRGQWIALGVAAAAEIVLLSGTGLSSIVGFATVVLALQAVAALTVLALGLARRPAQAAAATA